MKRFLLRGTAVLVGASAIALGAVTVTSAQQAGTVSGSLEGWHSPVQGGLTLTVTGRANGAKLVDATLLVDGSVVDAKSLCPADSTTQCRVEKATFNELKTAGVYGDGMHKIDVLIRDDAGGSFDIARDLEVWNNRPTGSDTATLDVGSGGLATPGAQNPGTPGGGGGVEGASATSCRSPRLSMCLSQKPLRVSKGVPVLLKNKKYRFTGRLTCLVGSKRKSAVKGAKISLRNVVGRKTVSKPGTKVKTGGKITLILRYASSRTLEFRYTNGDGKTSKVRIKVRIAQKAKG
jgi:hypothetical protein